MNSAINILMQPSHGKKELNNYLFKKEQNYFKKKNVIYPQFTTWWYSDRIFGVHNFVIFDSNVTTNH